MLFEEPTKHTDMSVSSTLENKYPSQEKGQQM
jgi:hypothetical protein